MSTIFLIVAISYLFGSIPFGYLLVRVFRGEDVRRSGSGNIGATNVSRKSPVLGVATLLLDAAKGAFAVWLAREAFDRAPQGFVSYSLYLTMSLAALFAVLGHMFPPWLKFRGGKGVATGLGSFLLFAPKAVVFAVVIFLVMAAILRYISLASIVAVMLFPSLAWRMREYGGSPAALLCIGLTCLIIMARHHENIRRLLAGTENRFKLRRG
jgi:glycerol-3-phosphate acyltransferase PlsY